MRIIVSNDDGVHAKGLATAIRTLQPFGELFVVAPGRPRSATGHGITLHKPLRMWEAETSLPVPAMACSGLPADCVTLAHFVLAGGKSDLCFAGINAGANLGWDVTYSGTVAAAMEGAILGIPAIAVSVTSDERSKEIYFESAARFVEQLIPMLGGNPMPRNSFLSVNVPNLPPGEIRGARVVPLGRREYLDRLVERKDPWEQTYYWQAGVLASNGDDEDTDVRAVHEGYIAVSPVHLDMTLHESLGDVSAWLRPLE